MDDSHPTRELLDPSLPEALATAGVLPETGSAGPSVVQTHLSHVFLTQDRVYKLHKDVDLGFVSFATQEARNRDCVRELVLNRRLAPDVYLGIVPIEPAGESWRVGAPVADPKELGPLEHCLVMRRLPDGRDALQLLEAAALTREQLDRLAKRLADFHREHPLPRPLPYSEPDWLRRIAGPVEANFESLLERTPGVVPESDVVALREATEHAWEEIQPAVARRRREGRAVDGHGDLHVDHVWFETDDAEPLVIDCIAFNEELRHIDPASDVAFLSMDLASRGHPRLAEHLLARYALAADDFGLYDVIDFFMSYRASVRAKVAALETKDERIPPGQRRAAEDRAQHRVDFARRVLAPRDPGRVYLVGGLIGGGKSTAARAIAAATGAVVISSDEVRRSIEARDASAAPGWREGRYSRQATQRIYDALLERATPVVASGRDVVLDASWASKERREAARAWATEIGAHAEFVEIRCSRDVALNRLEARQKKGTDASEAGPEIYDDFARAFDDVDEWPAEHHRIVETDREGWQQRLGAAMTDESPVLRALR